MEDVQLTRVVVDRRRGGCDWKGIVTALRSITDTWVCCSVALWHFSEGIFAGPGVRLPGSQHGIRMDYLEEVAGGHSLWQRNYCSVRDLSRSAAQRSQAHNEREGPCWGTDVRVDGWRVTCPWFSHELTQAQWPWIFDKRDKPAPTIPTLEAVAVSLLLKLFFGDILEVGRTMVQVFPTWTKART